MSIDTKELREDARAECSDPTCSCDNAIIVALCDELDAGRADVLKLRTIVRDDEEALVSAFAFINEHGPFVGNGAEVAKLLNERLYTTQGCLAETRHYETNVGSDTPRDPDSEVWRQAALARPPRPERDE